MLPLGTGERKEQNKEITGVSGRGKRSCQHQTAMSGLFDNKKISIGTKQGCGRTGWLYITWTRQDANGHVVAVDEATQQ